MAPPPSPEPPPDHPAAYTPDPVFGWAVASFEPTATGVLLWTRVTRGGTVGWEVATDPDFADVVARGTVDAADPEVPAPDGAVGADGSEDHEADDRAPDPAVAAAGTAVVVAVDGLTPATDHHYRFTLGDHVSPVGRTRTLPDGDQPVRLGLACCGDHSAGYFTAYRALAEADVDVVVHLGDYVYADAGGALRPTDPPHDAVTRADYRRRYAQTRRDPDLVALHLRHPVIAVIDDHDLADNAARTGAKGHDTDTQGPWADRVVAATAERADWLPVRTDGPPGREAPAEWRSVRLGDLGDLVLLDTRLAGRDPHADTDDPPIDDPDRTMLGAAQASWAVDRIRATDRPWVVVVSSVVFNEMTVPVPGHIGLNRPFPAGYLIDDGIALNSDGWDGYPAERARLVQAMRERGRGVVVLSGDVHSSWAFEGPVDDRGPVAVELTCPAVTSAPMGELLPVGGDLADRLVARQEGIRWADLFGRGHLVVEVAPTRVTASWWFTDPEVADATPRHAATWVHHRDRPGRLDPVDGTVPADRTDPTDPTDPADPTDRTDGAGGTGTGDGRGLGLGDVRRGGPDAVREAPPVPDRPAGVARLEARNRRRRRLRHLVSVGAAVVVAGLGARAWLGRPREGRG